MSNERNGIARRQSPRNGSSFRSFNGTIKLDVRDSKDDWNAFLDKKAPNDAPNVLVILYDAPPEATRSNWLPAPKGDFSLFIRAYWPKVEIIDGSSTPPPIKKNK